MCVPIPSANAKYHPTEQSDFQIRLVYNHAETEDEHEFLLSIKESGLKPPKQTKVCAWCTYAVGPRPD